MAKTTVGFAQVCDLDEGSLSPDLWQNIICEGELDADCFDKLQSEKDPGTTNFHGGPLLDDMTFNDEIPDIEYILEKLLLQAKRKQSKITCLFIRAHQLVSERVP